MAEFASLLEGVVKKEPSKLVVIQPKKAPKKNTKALGCEHCELNKTKKKFINKVHGRKVMIIGSAPSDDDEEANKLFKGSTGRFLWKELKKIGLSRNDCDLQVALKCVPEYGKHLASKEIKHPLKCCSLYTDQALEQAKAKIYIIFGIEAAIQALGKEYRKGTSILWSEKLNAKVYCLYDPKFFARLNYNKKALKEFRKNLQLIKEDLAKKTLSKYQFVDEQDYKGITTAKEAWAEVRRIKKYVKLKNYKVKLHYARVRLYCDEEAGRTKENDWFSLCVGTCIKPGRVRVFITHPKYVRENVRQEIIAALKELLEWNKLEKAFHHGSYDVPAIEKHLGIKTAPFQFDTNYSYYLYNPEFKPSFALDVVGLRLFPQFGEYKTLILPEAMPKDFDLKAAKLTRATPTQIHDYLSARGLLRLERLPLDKLIKYNAADCDLGKRIELYTQKKISLPLLSIYTDVSFTLDEMVKNGPYFDRKQFKKLKFILPPQFIELRDRIIKASGKKDFDPGKNASSGKMAWLLYDKLKIKPPPLLPKEQKAGKSPRSTGKNALEVLSRKYPIAKDILEYRAISKIISTYLDSYAICAKNNGGRLKTKWWLTGTRTGRLSSGGGKNKKADLTTNVINLQNVHGNVDIQNMLVPDPRWRKLYLAIKKAVSLIISPAWLKKLRRLGLDKKFKDRYEKLLEKTYSTLANSKKFKKYFELILKKYGNIKVVMGFDQGQIEVRVMGQVSGDKNLINDCKGDDVHSKVGHRMTGWPIEKIKKDKKTRTLTKNIHFGILFGLGAEGLRAFIMVKDPDSTLTEEEAIKLWKAYFKAYPGVQIFIERTREFVMIHGYVKNIFGFRRPLGKTANQYEEDEESAGGAFAGNQAINTPVQGAAHQLMLMAMTRLKDKDSKYRKILSIPGMEVHDALYWWTSLNKLIPSLKVGRQLLEEEPLKIVKEKYPEIKWLVPLRVEGKCGLRLGDTVELEDGMQLHEMVLKMFFETLKSEDTINKKYKEALAKAA